MNLKFLIDAIKIKEILYWIKQKKTNKNMNKKKIEIKWKRIRK